MLVEEIIRSCSNEQVAQAAVASIGRVFSSRVREAAMAYDMSVGEYTSHSVRHFARHGDEGELRAVLDVMAAAEQPILAGLHRILSIMLAAGVPAGGQRTRERAAPIYAAQACMMECEPQRGMLC